MDTLTPAAFIQKYLVDDIGNMIEPFPYHSFMAMAAGIEYLGKVLNPREDYTKDGESRTDFNNALTKLKAFDRYKRLYGEKDYNFYINFRCGLLHSFAPNHNITISSKDEEPHLTEVDGRLNLRAEDFYLDFRAACEEVIAIEGVAKKDMSKPYLHVPGLAHNTSGTTALPDKAVVASSKKSK
jgi:hypothetical protein